jgi:outer membrane protein OmpA-like peptidoglycan-associated protein
MADYDGLTPGEVLADASVAEFVKTLGLGIAEAQTALDQNSVNQIAEFIEPREGLGGKTLLDLGLSPAFYHYQHADISCSMQLTLRVEKDLSLGLNINGSLNDQSTETGNSSESQSSTESGSSTRTEARQANIQITSASAGSLNVGGRDFALTGDTPLQRIQNLRNALTTDPGTGIARVLFRLQPSPLTITTDADVPDEVVTTENSIAFQGGGFDRALIRIAQDSNTDYVLDGSHTASTTAQGSLETYANHVRDQIIAEGYDANAYAPTASLATFDGYNTGQADIKDEWESRLDELARGIIAMNSPVSIQGFTDRQTFAGGVAASDQQNRELGDNRAQGIQDALRQRGVPAALMSITPSTGERAAADAGDTRGQDNSAFRKVRVTSTRTFYLVQVKARDGGPNLHDAVSIAPNKIGDTGDTNGFIMLYRPSPLDLSGNKATIDGTDFPYDGAAAGGHPANDPKAYAQNLARDINAHPSANLKASAQLNVVTISRDSDPFSLSLVTAEQRNITLSGTSGITVTEQFSRSSSSSLTRQNTSNRTVAVGASVDVRFSRQFEMNVTGNSSISARLVSVPAPPQFLETIKEFLAESGE